MDSDVSNRCSGSNEGCRSDDCRSSEFGNLDVDLPDVAASQRDCDRMASGIARRGFHRRMVFVDALNVVIWIR